MSKSAPEITGHYVLVDSTRIYYDECGSGPTIVCIHTADACSLQFMYFLPEIAKKGLRGIAIDLPGHGKSYPHSWEPFRKMHDYSEFVWKFIKLVCPDEKPIVCGCSVGGSMTFEIACHHSRDMRAGIALEGTAHVDDPKQWCNFTANLENPAWCPNWRAIYERAGSSSLYEASGDKFKEWRWQHRYRAQEIGAGDLQCWVDHDVRDKLKNISCPLMAFKGEVDYWVPEDTLDYIVSSVPNGLAEKKIGPRMGHYPHFEKPEALADIIVEFLKRRAVI